MLWITQPPLPPSTSPSYVYLQHKTQRGTRINKCGTLNSYDSSMTTSRRLCSPRMGFPISAILRASSSSELICPSAPSVGETRSISDVSQSLSPVDCDSAVYLELYTQTVISLLDALIATQDDRKVGAFHLCLFGLKSTQCESSPETALKKRNKRVFILHRIMLSFNLAVNELVWKPGEVKWLRVYAKPLECTDPLCSWASIRRQSATTCKGGWGGVNAATRPSLRHWSTCYK